MLADEAGRRLVAEPDAKLSVARANPWGFRFGGLCLGFRALGVRALGFEVKAADGEHPAAFAILSQTSHSLGCSRLGGQELQALSPSTYMLSPSALNSIS